MAALENVLSNTLVKSAPLDFPSGKSVLSFFAHEKGLVLNLQPLFRSHKNRYNIGKRTKYIYIC